MRSNTKEGFHKENLEETTTSEQVKENLSLSTCYDDESCSIMPISSAANDGDDGKQTKIDKPVGTAKGSDLPFLHAGKLRDEESQDVTMEEVPAEAKGNMCYETSR